jgi:hypothetical protein
MPFLLLALASAVFCHRFFGVYFPIDGDVPEHLYYRLNESLIAADHNPYQWYYSSYFPFAGMQNPVIQVISCLAKIFHFTPVASALFVNMMTSWVLVTWLSCSVYLFLRKQNRTKEASFLGAVIVSFTGFQLSGIRQFDHLYLFSFAAVAPVFYSYSKLADGKNRLYWSCLAAFWIGLSFLGGGNTPLFMYLPFIVLFPLLAKKKKWEGFLWGISSSVVGVVAGAATLLPGIVYLADTNRAKLVFVEKSEQSVSMLYRLASFFIRAWGAPSWARQYEVEFFLGLPVILLTIYGGYCSFRRAKRSSPTEKMMAILLVLGLILLNLSSFPEWLTKPVGYFFSLLSIRFPHRFFMLCLFPIGYFAALGLDEFDFKKARWAILIVFLLEIWAVLFFVRPNWNTILPDMRIASIVSTVMGVAAVFLISTSRSGLGVLAVFLMFLFAPVQGTVFETFYVRQPQLLRYKITDVRDFLGLRWNYSAAKSLAEQFLLYPPRGLTQRVTLRGRILGPTFGFEKETNYFAGWTHHKFAFTNVNDPASPQRMRDLAEIGSEEILDLDAVCWRAVDGNSPSLDPNDVIYRERPSCFPEVFVVGKVVPTEDSLAWLRKASRNDLRNSIAVHCENKDAICTLDSDASSANVLVKSEEPGHFSFIADSPSKAMLFLSTPYRFDWKATVNGLPVTVYRADYAFMAVPLEKGKSVVELDLSTNVRLAGIGISFFLLSALGFAVRKFRSE